MQVLAPSFPARFKITQTMIEDFIWNPSMACSIIFNIHLDEFQKVALTIGALTPFVMDSSGYNTSKTFRMWAISNLRPIIMPERESLVCYPTFSTGQQSYWEYYAKVAAKSAIFRAHMGRERIVGLDAQTKGDRKAQLKGQSCWEFSYKTGGKVIMPAVDFLKDATKMASLRVHDLYVDEHTKAEATGSKGIEDQLQGRANKATFNQNHPFWTNHQYYCATAEDSMHPSYLRYRVFMDEIRRGNTDYAHITYNYKDWSDLPYYGTFDAVPETRRAAVRVKSFRDEFRIEKNILNMKRTKTPAKFREEGLGLWSRSGTGLYSHDMILRSREIGVERSILPIICRQQDWRTDIEKLKRVHYFLAGDPARAANLKADDGALVVLRVEPRVEKPTSNLVDWMVDFVWAYLVRRADATQWAAIIHRKNLQFDFTGLILDAGGGGVWVRPELAKARQIIRQQETKVTPIVCEEDEGMMVSGKFILSMFKVGDAKINKLWGNEHQIRGDDNLIDLAHTEFQTAMELGVIGLPRRLRDYPAELSRNWSEERRVACQLLEKGSQQLCRVKYRTDEEGKTDYTAHNARQFSAKGRKDFGYCMVYAFTRFLQWVKQYEDESGDQLTGEAADLAF